MTINKFQGKTQEEAIAKAKEEFGERAVIMNIREVKPKGLFRAFKNSTFEVTFFQCHAGSTDDTEYGKRRKTARHDQSCGG